MTVSLLLTSRRLILMSRCMLSVTSRRVMRKDVDDNAKGFREYEMQRPEKRRKFSKANLLFWMRKFEKVPMSSNVELVYYFQPSLYFIPSQFMLLPLLSSSIYVSLVETTLSHWIIWASYCFTIIYLLMAQLMRITPVRMYHDKKADKSVATFMNPFIPFTFSKVELQHHSYTATSKQFFKNDKHKLFIDTQYFRSVADINRLIIKK